MIASAPKIASSRWPVVFVALMALALVACTNQGSADGEVPASSGAAKAPEAANPAEAAKPQAAKPQAEKGAGARAHIEPADDVLKYPADWPDISHSRDRTVSEEKLNDPKNAAVRAKLDLVLPEINFDAVPFSDAVDHLRDISGANLFINWRALKNAGVDKTAPVTVRIHNIRFAKALAVVLDSLSGGTVPLGYTVDDGVITVSTGEDLDRNTITRVYDVRDLIVPIPNYDDAPAIGLHFDAPRPAPEAGAALAKEAAGERTRQELIDEVVRLITETVSPHSWRDAGGSVGSIRELQGQFIVTQTPQNHVDVMKLLDMLRHTRGVQIAVEARFITVDDAVLKALPADLHAAVEGEIRAARDPVPVKTAREGEARAEPRADQPKTRSETLVLNPKQVDQLLAAVQASRDSTIISAPRLTLFNGQSAYVFTSTQRAYAADYITIQEKDGSTRYEPQIATAQAGVLLWARATAGADRTFATVSVRPRLTQLAGVDKVPWDRSPPDMKLTVERPKILASELATTASIPDGQTLLLGGLKAHVTPDGKLVDEGAAGDPAVPVILLVKPKLIIQREIETRALPLNPDDPEPAR